MIEHTVTICFDEENEDDLDTHVVDIDVETNEDFEDVRIEICDAIRECLKKHPKVKDFTWCH